MQLAVYKCTMSSLSLNFPITDAGITDKIMPDWCILKIQMIINLLKETSVYLCSSIHFFGDFSIFLTLETPIHVIVVSPGVF